MPAVTTCPHCGYSYLDTGFDTLAAELAEATRRIRELESERGEFVDERGLRHLGPERAAELEARGQRFLDETPDE
jgi:uncharacterized protein (DUF2225 family)